MSHTLTFDTLAFVKKLEASGLDAKPSEAITNAISDVFEHTFSEVATKTDVAQSEMRLESKIDKMGAEFDSKLSKLKSELIIWVAGLLFAQTTLLSIIRFFH